MYFKLFLLLPQHKLSGPITKLWHIVVEMKLKNVVVHEYILSEFNVKHHGIKVKVIIALAKFNHITF